MRQILIFIFLEKTYFMWVGRFSCTTAAKCERSNEISPETVIIGVNCHEQFIKYTIRLCVMFYLAAWYFICFFAGCLSFYGRIFLRKTVIMHWRARMKDKHAVVRFVLIFRIKGLREPRTVNICVN